MLKANGVDDVFIDGGQIAADVRKRYPAKDPKQNAVGFPRPLPGGFDKVPRAGRRDHFEGLAEMCQRWWDSLCDRYRRWQVGV